MSREIHWIFEKMCLSHNSFRYNANDSGITVSVVLYGFLAFGLFIFCRVRFYPTKLHRENGGGRIQPYVYCLVMLTCREPQGRTNGAKHLACEQELTNEIEIIFVSKILRYTQYDKLC